MRSEETMEIPIKWRSSLDDSGGAASALRRLTQTPRLGLRRPSSTSSSSASSIISHEHTDEQLQNACVSRETSQDDCAFNRFMVWAAVRRNACQKMTPEERRECPLLRCRKRFPDHEHMLQHLYSCDQLAVGEYWCYECARVERFTDPKCKKCLRQSSSKRKKIMFMAKSFFSSLGHRSKNGSLPDLDLDLDEAPPSYRDSFDVVSTVSSQIELQANEIHEIDSNEVALDTIIEEEHEGPGTDPDMTSLQSPPPQVPIFRSPSYSSTGNPVVDAGFTARPRTVAPANLFNTCPDKNMEKPVLQLHTSRTDLEQYRSQKRRSKMLAPSSSVRSNASTASTNSTSSTASYNISPISAWSGAWTRNAGLDSTLTTPADEFPPENPFSMAEKSLCMNGSNDLDLHQNIAGAFSVELPADVPMLDITPPSDTFQGTLEDFFPSQLSLDPSVALDMPGELDIEVVNAPQHIPFTDSQDASSSEIRPPSTKSLVRTAWEALRMHVEESMARLSRAKDNHLVDKLRAMSLDMIGFSGLDTLKRTLDGVVVDSPVDLLCFLHLAYSLSLVIHEQDASNRGAGLFSQAVSYAARLSREDRHAYLPIVDVLWKPSHMSDEEVVGMIRKTSASGNYRSRSRKGKERQSRSDAALVDPLVFVAQLFLDELEYSAIQNSSRPEIQNSDLCVQHAKDASLSLHEGPHFDLAVALLHQRLGNEFADVPAFSSEVDGLSNSRLNQGISSIRHFELKLMNIGKTSLSPVRFFDSYVPFVRSHIDSNFTSISNPHTMRLGYHRLGVALMVSLIQNSQGPSLKASEGLEPTVRADVIDQFIQSITPTLDTFNLPRESDFDGTFLGLEPDCTLTGNMESSSVTPATAFTEQGPSTAGTSPPTSEEPTPPNNAKMESDSCCELCGYRPEGDPRWFPGSMAKHKKLQHATTPAKIYRCPYPGCTSQYKNRPDNLRQHQIKKGHFIGGEEEAGRRPSKRKKIGS